MTKIEISAEYIKTVNYALVNGRIPICKLLELTNSTEAAVSGLQVMCTGEYIKPCVSNLTETLEAGQTMQVPNMDILLDVQEMLTLPEHTTTSFKIRVMEQGDCVGEQDFELELVHDHYDLNMISNGKRELTKMDIWERKLLDFSLRNSLLNLYLRTRAIQFISFDVSKIEDHLASGEEYCIMPKPEVDFKINSEERLIHSKKLAESLHDLISDGIEHHRLHTYQTETETKNTLKNIYRGARNAIEETGANSLFLSIGTLRWYEEGQSDTPRYAPVILLPVEMVYKKGQYFIRTRDEETNLNITLMEFLRQNYNIRVENLDTLPKDEHGIDVNLIFTILRESLKEHPTWDIEEECILGTFSFSKFLMWNDVHNHREEMMQSQVVSSLVENRLTWTPDPVNVNLKEMDSVTPPTELALPVAVDSSQMAAVIEAGKGHSFILYGPPGTGKSQTITNLIANALFQGKRVLFVAEKMAALSVVQSRLAKIGLDPFCLEMHSNKVTKKHILEQFSKALGVTHIVSPAEYKDKAEKIFALRKELIEYLKALHNVDGNDNLSLYDCIKHYEAIDAEPMATFAPNAKLDAALVQHGLDELEDILNGKLDTVTKLVGQPSESPLKGLVLEQSNFAPDELVAKLQKAKAIVSGSRKQAADLQQVKSLRAALLRDNSEALLKQNAKALYDEWRSVKTKWFLPRFFAKKNYLNKLREFNKLITDADVDKTLDNLMQYQEKHKSIEELRLILSTHLGIDTPSDVMPEDYLLQDAEEKMERWIANKDKMRDWLHYCNYNSLLKEMGMECVQKALEAENCEPDAIRKSFFKALFKHKAERKMDKAPLLTTFEGMIFDEKVNSYKRLTEEFQMLTQKELYARLAARIPRVGENLDSSSEIGLLNRNISNGGRGMSLRELLKQIPTLLPRICPCMLMSPMSVAQYLDLSQEKFDLVVFDEASQMPTSEAVGAIARGKALIVVGDPKQMPPTSFFSSTNVDEEEANIDDMESILEDCRTLEMPSLQLNWHYRSRHESLIAFSNREYYDGSLITFPSVDDQKTKVSYIPVDGYYDKGGKRSNRAEAEAIVNEIERRLKDEKLRQQSIGVIAFSVVQQALIEDLLVDRMDNDKTLHDAADEMYEPIFIKNLENAQGDERDVILFSIGYGPNKEGVVSMNFGPLNNVGGERRLNVAVSRARCEMMVFSTLKASQIDLRRSKAKGVEGLKHFLEFAQTQTLSGNAASVQQDKKSMVAEKIAEALQQRGYKTQTYIGRSMFKVDVAICDKQNPEVYSMGLLLDGEGYRDTQTTRDREIVQPSVLTGLKWKVMRIWSVDWFNNPERVINRIVEQLEAEPAKEKPAQKLHFDISKEKVEETVSKAKPYIEFKANAASKAKVQKESICKDIVAAEQPISMMQLCRKVCALREMQRVTPTLQSEVANYCANNLYTQADRQGQVVWLDQASSMNYPWYRPDTMRDIADIPMIEIKNAVLEAITEQFSIATDNLSLIAVKKLGFTRRGNNVDAAFRIAVDELVKEGLVKEEDGKMKTV
ncbi:MAG: DUF4011 domain-containing protein [Bacteroidaceae bacterium]|nr:DUF4011 domain-containing protein [Bacteroidaceae bacterium]